MTVTELGCYVTPSGQRIKLRFMRKGDAPLLVEMFHRLSPETQRLRFQLYTTRLPEKTIWQEALKLTDLDLTCRVAIIATIVEEGDGREYAVGVARFIRATVEEKEAEVAVVVRDDYQRKGLGKYMLLLLADRARAVGLTHFTAWVTVENIRLMRLIKDMELKNLESETRHGQRKIRVPL